MKAPTDLQILQVIYDKYYHVFTKFDKANPDRDAKVYVPIDIDAVAVKLGVDGDIVFGRLYYDMNKRYAYEKEGAIIDIFANRVDKDIHCIQFPYMASVLAGLQVEHHRYNSANKIAWISLAIAMISLVVSIFL